MSHTKGPWVRTFDEQGEMWDVETSELDRYVAESMWADDASLIAAAPDLLDALRAIIDDKDAGYDVAHETWEVARAAIAKAEGKS